MKTTQSRKAGQTVDERIAALERLVAKQIREKHDPSSSAPTGTTLQGPFPGNANQFGIFSAPGVRPERFSALARPRSFVSVLTPQKSEFHHEILEIGAGVTAAGTANATSWCGNPPTPGQGLSCQQIYRFGNFLLGTRLNAVPEIGKLRNRADVPGEILNDGAQANPLIPEALFNLSDTRSQLQYELYLIGVQVERSLAQVSVTGIAGSDTGIPGWWREFTGLDTLIRTGYTDAVTGVACPAMDSAVVTWNANITDTVGGRSIVEAVTDTVWGLKTRADDVGMSETEHVLVMRRDAFRALVDQWACTYATYRCTGTAGNEVTRDGMAVQEFRVEMLNNQYLLVDGLPVPVLFSDGIPRTTVSANTYESDVYIVPLSWRGIPLLRLEYFDMANPYAQEYAGFVDPETVITMNDGLYLVGNRSSGLCVEYQFAAQMRLILETPFLAGRIDNIRYGYLAPTRDPYPGMSFYAAGGVTYRS